MNKIAILASGEGTTAEAFIRATQSHELDAEVVLVICNRPQAGIFKRIEELNQEYGLSIKTMLINGQTHPAEDGETPMRGGQTHAEEAAIGNALREADLDLIVLMGYLRLMGPRLVEEFGWQPGYTSPYQAMMLNSHPGLLPETAGTYGIHTQRLTIEQGMAFGGHTVHIVSGGYDDGPTIAEHKVSVAPDDTAESLFERVQVVEKAQLPIDIQAFIEGRQIYYQGGKS